MNENDLADSKALETRTRAAVKNLDALRESLQKWCTYADPDYEGRHLQTVHERLEKLIGKRAYKQLLVALT